MVEIVVEDAPWIPSIHRVSYILHHQWVKNAKPHAMTGGYVKYRDIDVELRERLRREWNRPNYGSLAGLLGVVVVIVLVLACVRRSPPRRSAQP
ncbi:MAG: hypothetical protein ACYS8K_10335 [Planctomycetota bacterium]